MTLIANRKGRTVDLSDSEKRIQEAMLRAWNTPAIWKDWTQTKLADKLGIPQPVISQYLNGKIPRRLWVCEVEGRELVNIETRESVLTLTGADDNVEFPARVKVHPLIGKTCLTGIV